MQLTFARCVDWLGFTFGDIDSAKELYPGMLPGAWLPTEEAGRYGFGGMWRWQACELWARDARGRAHIDCSGRGCLDLAGAADVPRSVGWGDILGDYLARGGRASRLDIAWDLMGDSHLVEDCAAALELGAAKSRWKPESWREMHGLGDRGRGHTIYLGSPTSDSLCRIYDKRAEQGLPATDEPWVRIEWQCRRGVAHAVARRLADKGWSGVGNAFRSYLDLLDSAGQPLAWFVEALDAPYISPLRVGKDLPTFDSRRRWVYGQVAPTLAALFEAEGGDLGEIGAVMAAGRARQTAVHRSMIEERRRRESLRAEATCALVAEAL